jgi:hypothetical protein
MIFVQANLFPNVPNLAGVPQLARAAAGFAYLPAPTLGTQAPLQALFHATLAAPVWGVYDSEGNQAIEHDSMRSFDYRAEWAVADFPVQDGGYASYDKVTRAFDASVTLVKGGSASDRTNFLNQCETVAGALQFYQIFTPEKHYLNVSCTRMELSRRETNRAFFVEVELFFREIREVTAQYSSTATATQNASAPQALPPANTGPVQPATPSVQSAAGAAVAVSHGASGSF